MEQYILVKEHKVVLEYEENFGYVPIIYDYDPEKQEGKLVSENPMLTNWLIYVRRANVRLNKLGTKKISRNLYYEQHSLAIVLLLDIQQCKSSKWLIHVARQYGKTALAEDLAVFCTLEMPRWSARDFPLYTVLITSYNAQATEKFYLPIRQKIIDKIDIFNEMHPESLIFTKDRRNQDLSLNLTKENIEIGITRNGKSEKYSTLWALGAESKYGRDGMSTSVLIVDEVSKINGIGDGGFMQSFLPMLSSTNGTLIAMGITSIDPVSTAYLMYVSPVYQKYIRNWEDVYRIKKANDPNDAEGYKKDVLDFKVTMGETSTEWLTNYMMSYDIIEDSFITRDSLRRNNVMQTDIKIPVYNPEKFIVAGLDLSTGGASLDKTVMVVAEQTFSNGLWFTNVIGIIGYGSLDENLDSSTIISDTVKYLNTYHVDVCLVDSTSTQKLITNEIINSAKASSIGTQIIPFYFSGSINKKHQMMLFLENCLTGQTTRLPKEELLKTNKEWNTLYNEMLTLEKKRTDKTVLYRAPKNKHDDYVMALALCNYVGAYVSSLEEEGKDIEIGKYKWRPKYKKWLMEQEKEKPILNWLYRW